MGKYYYNWKTKEYVTKAEYDAEFKHKPVDMDEYHRICKEYPTIGENPDDIMVRGVRRQGNYNG